MDPFHFSCPHCSSRLRVREKLLVGRQVDCPECGDTLVIVDRGGEMGAERVERKDVERKDVPQLATTAGDATKSQKRKRAGPGGAAASVVASKSPAVPNDDPFSAAAPVPDASPQLPIVLQRALSIPRRWWLAGGAAVGLIVVLVGVTFWPSHKPQGTDESHEPPAGVAGDGTSGREPNGDEDDRPAELPAGPRDDLDARLSKIGELLLELVASEKAFPAGTFPAPRLSPENRLSWMATLAERLDDDSGPVPLWDRAWNDPQNEPFVRRRLTMFQNPALDRLIGVDGYPAGHFVGVAGVGADAATLTDRDPRAGVFGYDRRTKLEDIHDGASNTLLVLGVREHLGSWAAGGTPTVRGLSREPYVNGPDGFGTGSPDAMAVLMADGRVVTVNRQIDPRILRRMAAKSDGLPLDESVPGEPADRPFAAADEADPSDPENTPEGELTADERPIDPEFAPEPTPPPVRKFDLAVSLQQPIARFDQPRSKPLAEVLESVAEMAGARITIDEDELGPAAARLAEPVALRLESTTVGEILSGLLQPAGLAYRIEGDHLRVVRATP